MYRLNGDKNLLHVDIDYAKKSGLERPILHGLCSFGITARLLNEYCYPISCSLKKMTSRFTNFVYPGDTFVVHLWKEENMIIFETIVKERNECALFGFIELTKKCY